MRLKSPSDGGIRQHLLAPFKGSIVLVKLRLQYPQSVEFGEQQSGRLAHRPHGIIRMLCLPCSEVPLRNIKIQVIQIQETLIQSCPEQGDRTGMCAEHEEQTQAECDPETRSDRPNEGAPVSCELRRAG